MRVLLDTNVLISALLSQSRTLPMVTIEHALAGDYELMVSELTVKELRHKIASKAYLADRLAVADVETFLAILRNAGSMLPEPDVEIPEQSRDRNDDYLLFHAKTDRADYIVTGDKDLLVLGQVADTRIVSPAAFVAILDSLAS